MLQLLALLVCCGISERASAQLRINEVCSNNVHALATAEDESPDWIELINAGSSAIDLHDYYLSDKLSEPWRWRLPQVVLGPGELVLFLSGEGEDRFPFGIDMNGERLVLSNLALQPVEVMDVPHLRADHSIGLVDGALRYFDAPTPNAPNANASYNGYAPKPIFNRAPGYQSQGTAISASAPNCTVHWTVNGREPDESAPLAGTPLILDSTVIVLARSFRAGWLPSDIASATYLVGEHHTLPVVSLAVDPDSMFHETYGLYMMGPNADPEYPHWGANFWSERSVPVHMEYYEASGVRGLTQQVDVKIHGGRRSRTNPQRPLRLTAKGKYGAETMRYPFFPERGRVEDYKTLVLRNSGGDFCLANFRDALFHQVSLHNGLDIDELAFRPAICYINGRYWGLIEIRERIDNDHLHHNYGADPEAVLMMEEENWSMQGDTIHSWLLQEFIRTQDLNVEANWSHVDSLLDVHSLMDYFAVEMIAGNVDWPSNNLKYWKPSVTEGKWRYLMYDLDATMVLYGWIPEDLDMFYWTFVHRAGFFHAELLRGLMGRHEFRRQAMNRMADLMNTVFREDRFQAEVDKITGVFAPEIEAHFNRWGCWFPVYQEHAFGIIPHFITHRNGYMRQHAIDWFGFANAALLDFQVFPPNAGTLRINTIEPELPFKGWYWNGNDIDVTALPADGYVFSHWTYSGDSEQSESTQLKRSFATDGSITAYFRPINGAVPAFPNPTEGSLTLGVEAAQAGSARIVLSDVTGRTVLERTIAVEAGMNRAELDVSGFRAGVLLVTIEADGDRRTTRVVKQ